MDHSLALKRPVSLSRLHFPYIMLSRCVVLVALVLSLNCLDDSGNAVSWYTALKLTKYANGPFQGKTFAVPSKQYFDASHLENKLQDRALNQSTFMTYTLNQLNSDTVSYVLYK